VCRQRHHQQHNHTILLILETQITNTIDHRPNPCDPLKTTQTPDRKLQHPPTRRRPPETKNAEEQQQYKQKTKL
jgi:hypothetical protein